MTLKGMRGTIYLDRGVHVIEKTIYLDGSMRVVGHRDFVVIPALKAFYHHVRDLLVVHVLKKLRLARTAPIGLGPVTTEKRPGGTGDQD
jgi:hypothetical protein